jgi:hypothetical protein
VNFTFANNTLNVTINDSDSYGRPLFVKLFVGL